MSKDSKREAYKKGQRDYKKCGGQANLNPITEFFHPSYDSPSKYKKNYDDGWNNGKKQKKSKSSSPCFISTACVEAMELPDDCLELTTLRNFRDKGLIHMPGGRKVIEEYKIIAPSIVNTINYYQDKRRIWTGVFDDLVRRSVDLVIAGKNEEAFNHYKSFVNELKDKYC